MNEKYTILIVDDTPDNLLLMSDVLKSEYKVMVANNGFKALKIAFGDNSPDLILLDVMMPEMDGYEVCEKLVGNPKTKNIPVIFLTAKSLESDVEKGLDMGAVDYITKPISVPILLARVKTQLRLKMASDFLVDNNKYLEAEVKRQTNQVSAIQDVSIFALATLAETRDTDTGNHIKRTQLYLEALCESLKEMDIEGYEIDDAWIELTVKCAPLHDIGKVGIPDSILLKPDRLDNNEFEIMKDHVTIGRNALENAIIELKAKVEFLDRAIELVFYHHERWDGGGYPTGIKGMDIPLAGRMMAVVDVYDALTSKRIYKDKMSHEDAMVILKSSGGTHFDPVLVDAFMNIGNKVKGISVELSD